MNEDFKIYRLNYLASVFFQRLIRPRHSVLRGVWSLKTREGYLVMNYTVLSTSDLQMIDYPQLKLILVRLYIPS